MTYTINLQKELAADLDAGLLVEVFRCQALTYETGVVRSAWGLRISKPTTTATGRPGKPKKLLNVIGAAEATPATMLEAAKVFYEQGDIEMVKA